MKLVTAVIDPHRLDEVTSALVAFGVKGLTVTEATGLGRARGPTELYRGSEYSSALVARRRIEVLCDPHDADDVVQIVVATARSGEVGDGKVWVVDVDRVVRISTGELDDDAV